MEFLNISDTKLKVTLTKEECRTYHIDTARSDSYSDIKHAIKEIISIAGDRCGFRAGGDRLLVQIYPMPDSSCELFVTRLARLSRRDRAELCATDGIALIEQKRGVYRFSTLTDMQKAVSAVYRDGINSDLYLDDLGRYYIHAVEDLTDSISELEAFVEFGERLQSLPIAVLSEYGTLLIKGNAIDKIHRGEIPNTEE